MSTELILPTDTEEEPKSNVIPLKLVTGGGNTFDPRDPSWVATLGVGTIFYAQEKNNQNNFIAQEFCVAGKTDKVVLLLLNNNDDTQVRLPVIAYRFGRKYELTEILRSAEQYEYERAMNEALGTLGNTAVVDPKEVEGTSIVPSVNTLEEDTL